MATTTESVETTDAHDDEAHHPSDWEYIKIALLLGFLTALEVGMYFLEDSLNRAALFIGLTVLMIVKFVLVVAYFMHLKYDRKFNIFLEKAFDIAHLTEYMISILWQRIINAISQDRIQDPELFIELFSRIINQDDVWNMMSVEQYFKLREYGKWNESLNELYRSIHGNNMLKFIKEELTIKQIQSAFDNFVM